jgi:hypothetical protein
MYGALIASFPMLLAFREQYKRLMVDKGRDQAPASLQNSIDVTAERRGSDNPDDNHSITT